jgi:hypothetical protein
MSPTVTVKGYNANNNYLGVMSSTTIEAPYTPGEVMPAYATEAPANTAIPLHNHVMAFNWYALMSDLSASGNPFYHLGNTEHQYFLRHTSSYFSKELWDFMRLPSLEVEVKACGPWTDYHSFSGGSSSSVHKQNRYRLKDTNTGEYWNWGPQKNFDFGMANGEWSSFVPFLSNASLMSISLDPNSSYYMDIRADLQTIANGGGAPANYGDTQESAWINALLSSMGAGLSAGHSQVAYGGTYNSKTNTFEVVAPTMASYLGQTRPTTYAGMWSSTQAIASAAVLEGIPAQWSTTYNSPGGMTWDLTAFYPNLTFYNRSGHAWHKAYVAYLSAGVVYALNEPPSPNLSEFFTEDSTQYRFPAANVAPQRGVKSIKGPDANLIVEQASPNHYDEHGFPINDDFLAYSQGGMSSWLVPLVGNHWYIPNGSSSQVRTDAPDTLVCGYVPPYFT